ncbi:MAG TPA: hypothetical protein VHN18_03885, partial [Micromonosporaceae bacterium]|nr:hypothetical protein [Micromonosporaceae bacterium]
MAFPGRWLADGERRLHVLTLVLRALAARRAPAVALLLLTVLAAGAAAAAPQYIVVASRDLAAATVERAAVTDRIVAVETELVGEQVAPDR